MNGRVDVQTASDDDIPEPQQIERWVLLALEAAGGPADAEVSVRVVGLDEGRRLNRDYRGRDAPTNVLSFPATRPAGLPEDEPAPLGDIVVCAPVVVQEAAEQGKRISDHWAHLLVHGALHLLGYDHQAPGEAAEMESLEVRILEAHGLPDPYGARHEN